MPEEQYCLVYIKGPDHSLEGKVLLDENNQPVLSPPVNLYPYARSYVEMHSKPPDSKPVKTENGWTMSLNGEPVKLEIRQYFGCEELNEGPNYIYGKKAHGEIEPGLESFPFTVDWDKVRRIATEEKGLQIPKR